MEIKNGGSVGSKIVTLMRRKSIWLLAGIMAFTMIWLIVVQARWIENALIVKEQAFARIVNKAMYEIVQDIEERETIMQITNETFSFGSDTSDMPGIEMFITQNLSDPDPADFNYFVIGKDSAIYEVSENPAEQIRVTGKYSPAELRLALTQKLKAKTVFFENVINRLIRKEINLDERIDLNTLHKIIETNLKSNEINLPYEFAVRTPENMFTLKSEGFNLDYIKKTYEILMYPNDILSSQHYLVVYFSKDKSFVTEEMPQPILTSIILTIIISLTFGFTMYIILKQRKLSELKNDFISNMTHELKTPVSTISLASQMLKDPGLSLDRTRIEGITRIIDDESRRLGFQVDKVLQTSLFEKGRIHLKFKETDVHALIKNAVDNTRLRVSNKGGKITTDLQAVSFLVPIDDMHFTNVIFNLLDNALKYSREDVPPFISVHTSDKPKGIAITVADNGIGIPREHQKKIFNKFYRVQKGNVHNVKGFGLGLNYVKRIVDEHNGSINVKSEFGKGTAFEIILPKKQKK